MSALMAYSRTTLDATTGQNDSQTYGRVEHEVRERPDPEALIARTRAGVDGNQNEGTEVYQIGNVLRAPELRILRESPRIHATGFKTAKKWECVVLEVAATEFTARLLDEIGTSEDSISTFSLDEVTRDDRRLVEPGAIFYWSIGYKENTSGVRTRESILVFRRVPAWSNQAIERIKKESERMSEYFNNDTPT